jgi:hypothetical protein
MFVKVNAGGTAQVGSGAALHQCDSDERCTAVVRDQGSRLAISTRLAATLPSGCDFPIASLRSAA